jgi:hypothetical protein
MALRPTPAGNKPQTTKRQKETGVDFRAPQQNVIADAPHFTMACAYNVTRAAVRLQ